MNNFEKKMEGIMKNWDQITPLPTPSQNMQVNEYMQVRSSCKKKKISVNYLHYLKEKNDWPLSTLSVSNAN